MNMAVLQKNYPTSTALSIELGLCGTVQTDVLLYGMRWLLILGNMYMQSRSKQRDSQTATRGATNKGRWDVTGIIGNMLLVNSGSTRERTASKIISKLDTRPKEYSLALS